LEIFIESGYMNYPDNPWQMAALCKPADSPVITTINPSVIYDLWN